MTRYRDGMRVRVTYATGTEMTGELVDTGGWLSLSRDGTAFVHVISTDGKLYCEGTTIEVLSEPPPPPEPRSLDSRVEVGRVAFVRCITGPTLAWTRLGTGTPFDWVSIVSQAKLTGLSVRVVREGWEEERDEH